jgi:hypothetical protein
MLRFASHQASIAPARGRVVAVRAGHSALPSGGLFSRHPLGP